MVKKKTRKHKSTKRCRTALELEEEQSRTLYVRLPKTIKNAEEIKSLFLGDVKIKLPRQSSRHCFVIFPSIEEKIKNMKEVKEKQIEGKPILTATPNPIDLEKKKKRPKKIKIPDPAKDSKESTVSKYLFISNIAPGTKASEIRDAFPGSLTVALLKGLTRGTRQARVKMSASHLCVHYVNNDSEWPVFGGKKVYIMHSTSKNKPGKKKSARPLKIYDGESDAKDVKDENGKKSSEEEESAESGDSDEERSDIKEEDDSDKEQSDVKEEVESADESEEAEEDENSEEE